MPELPLSEVQNQRPQHVSNCVAGNSDVATGGASVKPTAIQSLVINFDYNLIVSHTFYPKTVAVCGCC